MPRIVAIVDCESTGLLEADQPISIGAILVSVEDSGISAMEGKWYGEQEPTVSISPGAFAVHGRTLESLRGASFDLDGLRSFLSPADTVIAHNASFDRRMIGSVYPDLHRIDWRCSYRQWPWPMMYNKKLETVREHFGIAVGAGHHALNDATTLHLALSLHSGKTKRSSTYYKRLLDREAFQPGAAPIARENPTPKPSTIIQWADKAFISKHCVPGAVVSLKLIPPDRIVGHMRSMLFFQRLVVSMSAADNPCIAEALRAGKRVSMVSSSNDGRTVNLVVKADD